MTQPLVRWTLLLCTLFALACARRPAPTQVPEAPRSASRADAISETEALVAYARLYGYVRFFHPTDRAAEAQWQKLAAQGAAHVRSARTVGELSDRLEDVFGPLAPQLAVWVGSEPRPAERRAPRAKDGHVFWQYQGYVGTPVSLYRPPYERVRVGAGDRSRRRFSEMPDPSAVVEATLLSKIHVRLPLVLSASEAAAQGGEPALLDAQIGALALDRDGFQSLDVRQGAVIEVWNILRHFYPYQAEVKIDWEATLARSLEDAVDDGSRQDFADTLARMVRALEDGHGEVGHPRLRGKSLPFRVDWVEGRAVVTATEQPQKFAVGDVISAIDGEPMKKRIERIEKTLSGSKQWRLHKATSWLATRGPSGRSVEVRLERAGKHRTVHGTYELAEVPEVDRGAPFHRFPDGVVYVDLTRIDDDELRGLLPELSVAPGVVFDMRGYPDNTHFIVDHLLPEAEDALWLNVPKIVAPDGQFAAWHQIGWHRRPAEPRISGEVAFLTSPAAISYAESILSYVEAHDLGVLIGSASAGANGDIVRVDTLAGYFVIFSGMRVTRHDGTSFHRIGVRPDLEVKPTVSGIRQRRDEPLEAALEHVRSVPAQHLANTEAGTKPAVDGAADTGKAVAGP